MALAAPAAVALGERLPHLAPGLAPGPRATHKIQLAPAPVLALVRALVHLERQKTMTDCSVWDVQLDRKAEAGFECRPCSLSASADWLPVTPLVTKPIHQIQRRARQACMPALWAYKTTREPLPIGASNMRPPAAAVGPAVSAVRSRTRDRRPKSCFVTYSSEWVVTIVQTRPEPLWRRQTYTHQTLTQARGCPKS